jgi:hypothetical protein
MGRFVTIGAGAIGGFHWSRQSGWFSAGAGQTSAQNPGAGQYPPLEGTTPPAALRGQMVGSICRQASGCSYPYGEGRLDRLIGARRHCEYG